MQLNLSKLKWSPWCDLCNCGSDQNLSVIKVVGNKKIMNKRGHPISTSSMVEEKISLKVSVKR
jgi:hypothetical protein